MTKKEKNFSYLAHILNLLPKAEQMCGMLCGGGVKKIPKIDWLLTQQEARHYRV